MRWRGSVRLVRLVLEACEKSLESREWGRGYRGLIKGGTRFLFEDVFMD